jgi:hypothetical protein
MTDEDNETWLLDAGDEVIQAKAAHGIDSLSARDRLIYCLWVADYAMRNAGDLSTASDLYAPSAAQLMHRMISFSHFDIQ